MNIKHTFPFSIILSNSAVADADLDAINSITGVFSELTLADGEKSKRYRYVKYGNYPQKIPGVGDIVQVVDREAAELLAANFRQYAGLDVFFRGVPVYEGHPDDPTWLAENPGHKTSAVARIKTIEPGDDGIYVTEVFNSDGVAMLSGEAPRYSGHSPRWKLMPVPGKPKHYRPALLVSDGLTNTPNIPDSKISLNSQGNLIPSPDSPDDGDQPENQNDEMKLTPEALKALGFAPDATPSETDISAAIVKLLGEKDSADAAKATAETAINSKVTEITALRTRLAAVQGTAVDVVVNAAVQSGRITEAEKPQWVTALNSDFDAEKAKLMAKMPVINTTNQVAGLGDRKSADILGAAGAIDAMNAAVRAHAAEHHLDISTPAGFDAAWTATKAAKPELFQK